MKPSLDILALSAGFLFVLFDVGFADEFELSFAGPASLLGDPGTTSSSSYDVRLKHINPDGATEASGWSFAAIAENAAITDITVDNTISCDASLCPDIGMADGGFAQTELASPERNIGECEGRSGAISAVILALIETVTLPSGPDHVIARIQVEAMILDDGPTTASLRFVNGCAGSGQPVETIVTQTGLSFVPLKFPLEINLRPLVCFCDEEIAVVFSSTNVGNGAPIWADGIGIGDVDPLDPCGGSDSCAAAGVSDLVAGPGDVVNRQLYVNIVSQLPGVGDKLSGWSFSVKFDALGTASKLIEATTDGTASCDSDDCPGVGLADGGFDQTELIRPKENNGAQGAVSAVVLALISDAALPVGQSTVLALSFEVAIPEGGSAGAGDGGIPAASIFLLDGLRGSGQPVANIVTVGGSSVPFSNTSTARVDFIAAPSQITPFVRGNANDDNKVDIADAIWIINSLFRGGAEPPCLDAGDANDNGIVDLADAQFLLIYLFPTAAQEFGLDSTPPVGPFPDCGFDPTDVEGGGDGLGCQISSFCRN